MFCFNPSRRPSEAHEVARKTANKVVRSIHRMKAQLVVVESSISRSQLGRKSAPSKRAMTCLGKTRNRLKGDIAEKEWQLSVLVERINECTEEESRRVYMTLARAQASYRHARHKQRRARRKQLRARRGRMASTLAAAKAAAQQHRIDAAQQHRIDLAAAEAAGEVIVLDDDSDAETVVVLSSDDEDE